MNFPQLLSFVIATSTDEEVKMSLVFDPVVDEIIICVSSSQVSDELAVAGKFWCQMVYPNVSLAWCLDVFCTLTFPLRYTKSHLLAKKSHTSFSFQFLEK